MTIREYRQEDLPAMTAIWNEVVEEGNAFPQDEPLDEEQGAAFFASQSYTGVADEDGTIYGLYILHPNNVGRCGHICNASYAVSSGSRG
ncbi:MAG: GNAT family N-acetyltransferase, partial [Clostridiales bacterium]|nr:GNAT family N-acetyltransferase [Clostridiales bacterium]